MRAIVMDDSRVVRMALRRTLEELTFEVTDFPDADSGYVWLQRGGRADVALVDWNMPGMSGVEFVEVVRRDPAYDQMFLVMVTSESAPERMQLALERGADEYVLKPVAANGLREKLELLGFRWSDTVAP
jgi:two-component system, chemotaxis family, chemotaxis protein CheY